MFANRSEAGRRLASSLVRFRGADAVVVGLPRGGVPVAFEVAQALRAPLDVILVRKLGLPFRPELAMGAIGEDGVRVLDDRVVRVARVTAAELRDVEQRERNELARRATCYRQVAPMVPLRGRTAIVVDDGIATGSTARAACHVARAHGARTVVLAAPVASSSSIDDVRDIADEVICLHADDRFAAVGQYYDDFSPTSDDEVIRLLRAARVAFGTGAPPSSTADAPRHDEVVVPVDGVRVGGNLVVPPSPRGLVVFAHGSGSSRHSQRNRDVASVLGAAGFATFLFDLLTPDEALDRANVFDIDLLARRLLGVTRWLRHRPELAGLAIGYFGASTGAAAALRAAAAPGCPVEAVVSRGGRPDLASSDLAAVTAPTLLIVGGLDHAVLELNRAAQTRLRCEHELVVVPGATHLFEEPGTLATAADAAAAWFDRHLARGSSGSAMRGEAAGRRA